jgi:hypothetical protein
LRASVEDWNVGPAVRFVVSIQYFEGNVSNGDYKGIKIEDSEPGRKLILQHTSNETRSSGKPLSLSLNRHFSIDSICSEIDKLSQLKVLDPHLNSMRGF